MTSPLCNESRMLHQCLSGRLSVLSQDRFCLGCHSDRSLQLIMYLLLRHSVLFTLIRTHMICPTYRIRRSHSIILACLILGYQSHAHPHFPSLGTQTQTPTTHRHHHSGLSDTLFLHNQDRPLKSFHTHTRLRTFIVYHLIQSDHARMPRPRVQSPRL